MFLRQKGSSASDAADLTQEFFTRVLEKRYFDHARRERGTFRTFLLTCAKNFLANEWDRATAKKRGGGQPLFSLDQQEVEHRYQMEQHDDLTPERIFEQQWAWSVVDQAIGQARTRCACCRARGAVLVVPRSAARWTSKSSLSGDREAVADQRGAVKVQVHRLRKRLRELILEEVEQAGATGHSAEAELHHLLTLLIAPRQ